MNELFCKVVVVIYKVCVIYNGYECKVNKCYLEDVVFVVIYLLL